MADFESVDQYIESFPPEVRSRLEEARTLLRETAPDAVERISYGMPAYTRDNRSVYFAAFKHHLGFYPGESAIEEFRPMLEGFKTAVGSVQFPNNRALPAELVRKIVRFRLYGSADGGTAR